MSVIAALLLSADAPALSMKVEISPAVMALGQKYGKAPSAQFERDLETLEKAGDRTAAVLLGELLMMPVHPGGPDYARSCDHSEAGGQHPEGLQNLATCYFKGSGRPQDLAKARELYRQAADQGYAKAACAYGNMLIKGEGGPTDVGRGLDLCRRAADAGIADAQTDFGGYLLTNQYLAKDATKARRYLSLAAAQGQANAAFLLGQIYWNGDGVEKDLAEAAKWLTVAYNGGRVDAAHLIGGAALRQIAAELQAKQAVPSDQLNNAIHWFSIAAEQDPDVGERQKAAEALKALNALGGKK